MVARRAHNPEVGGSNPPPATMLYPRYAGFFIVAVDDRTNLSHTLTCSIITTLQKGSVFIDPLPLFSSFRVVPIDEYRLPLCKSNDVFLTYLVRHIFLALPLFFPYIYLDFGEFFSQDYLAIFLYGRSPNSIIRMNIIHARKKRESRLNREEQFLFSSLDSFFHS